MNNKKISQSVRIPRAVWRMLAAGTISPSMLVTYCALSALSRNKRECSFIVHNAHISKITGLSARTVTRSLYDLHKRGLTITRYDSDDDGNDVRTITVVGASRIGRTPAAMRRNYEK